MRTRELQRAIADGAAWPAPPLPGNGPPDHVADVVGHQQRAALVDRHAHRPAVRLAVRR